MLNSIITTVIPNRPRLLVLIGWSVVALLTASVAMGSGDNSTETQSGVDVSGTPEISAVTSRVGVAGALASRTVIPIPSFGFRLAVDLTDASTSGSYGFTCACGTQGELQLVEIPCWWETRSLPDICESIRRCCIVDGELQCTDWMYVETPNNR